MHRSSVCRCRLCGKNTQLCDKHTSQKSQDSGDHGDILPIFHLPVQNVCVENI